MNGYGAGVLVLWVPLVPGLLLLLLLAMERLETRVARRDLAAGLEEFLATARPEEVETFVAAGYATALEDYWSRRAPRRASTRAA